MNAAAPVVRLRASACAHCGAAIEQAPGASADAYCCVGCETAAAIIRGAGLDQYYAERTAPAPRPAGIHADWASIPVEPAGDGIVCARLTIDGIQCASCVWVVENVLQRTPGVARAHVSYATGRARLAFDPAVVSLAELGERIASLGYRPRPSDAPPTADRDLLVRLGVSAFCAANVMLLAISVYTGWFSGMEERYTALFQWASLALATPIATWAAVPFYRSAWTGLRAGVLHMDLPISLAVAALYVHGVGATLMRSDAYLDSLAMLVTLLLAGRVLEARGRRDAAAAASAIASELPATARRVRADGGVDEVPVSALAVGDVLEVGLGDTIAADGVVATGSGAVRMALLTGESEPQPVAPGDPVVAGASVATGSLSVRVERVGDATLGRRMAAEILASVDVHAGPTPADRLAPVFTAGAIGAAGAALIGWTAAVGLGVGIERMAAVLVVACPCALGLSWPIAVASGLGAAARRGVVLRSGDVLLRLADVDVIALDKTGTVTSGEPVVVAADDRWLRVAAGLDRASSHPIARAIRAEAGRRGIPLPASADVVETPGVGITGVVDGVRWRLERGAAGELRVCAEDPAGADVFGVIHLRDVRRADAAPTVAALRRSARVVVLTGDHAEVGARLAAEVGADEVHAGMRPDDKRAWIAARQAEGRRVLYVGDGLNDGPAIVAADVGLAMRSGASASVLAADGVVAHEALAPVLAAIRASGRVRAAVHNNLVRSVVYNVAAVAAALAGWVDPLVAAVLMPASSLLVLWGGTRVERDLQRLERAAKEERWT